MYIMKCKRCGYEWEARKEEPKECPRCKARLDVEKKE
jgi:predicted Zn-ribbon and HTH transcriptional regulator